MCVIVVPLPPGTNPFAVKINNNNNNNNNSNNKDSLAELSVTCAIACRVWKPTHHPVTWFHPDLLKPVMEDKQSGTKMGDHERLKFLPRYTNIGTVLQCVLLGSNSL
jgi:hypothetical protein